MFENVINFLKNIGKKEEKQQLKSKDAAKERLQLVLMQDRANISADFLDLMKQEIIEVIKKYIDVDENAIDVRLTNKSNEDGTNGAPSLYANIPIISIKEEVKVGMARQSDIQKNENESKEPEKEIKNEAEIEVQEDIEVKEQIEPKEDTIEEQEQGKKENLQKEDIKDNNIETEDSKELVEENKDNEIEQKEQENKANEDNVNFNYNKNYNKHNKHKNKKHKNRR